MKIHSSALLFSRQWLSTLKMYQPYARCWQYRAKEDSALTGKFYKFSWWHCCARQEGYGQTVWRAGEESVLVPCRLRVGGYIRKDGWELRTGMRGRDFTKGRGPRHRDVKVQKKHQAIQGAGWKGWIFGSWPIQEMVFWGWSAGTRCWIGYRESTGWGWRQEGGDASAPPTVVEAQFGFAPVCFVCETKSGPSEPTLPKLPQPHLADKALIQISINRSSFNFF